MHRIVATPEGAQETAERIGGYTAPSFRERITVAASVVTDRTRTHERDCILGNRAVHMALVGRGFLCRIMGDVALYARSWRALVTADVAALRD